MILSRTDRIAFPVVFVLVLVVVAHIGWYGAQLYMVDVIGRTNLVSALELTEGRPIYSTPSTGGSVSMSYTPGFPLLAAVTFKILGFSRWLWNSIWVSVDLAVLFGATTFLFRRSRWFSVLVPASMLGCLYPVVWARGDIAATGLFWLGWALLDMVSVIDKKPNQKLIKAFALIALAMAVFFKQTMLPPVVISLLISTIESSIIGIREKVLYFLRISIGSLVVFAIFMVAYMVAFNEDPVSMFEVMTLGKEHAVRVDAFANYLLIYVVVSALPTLVSLRSGGNVFSLTLLHLMGLFFVLFAAKAGGSWHHLMPLVLPWGDYLFGSKFRKESQFNDIAATIPALLVCTLGFFLMFRPSLASKEDISAAHKLSHLLVDLSPSNGDILIFDADGVFAFPDAAYKYGFKTRWDRGALEEWSAATKIVPVQLITDIANDRFQQIIIRGNQGSFPTASAYGVPYKLMTDTIIANYEASLDNTSSGWVTYYRKHKAP